MEAYANNGYELFTDSPIVLTVFLQLRSYLEKWREGMLSFLMWLIIRRCRVHFGTRPSCAGWYFLQCQGSHWSGHRGKWKYVVRTGNCNRSNYRNCNHRSRRDAAGTLLVLPCILLQGLWFGLQALHATGLSVVFAFYCFTHAEILLTTVWYLVLHYNPYFLNAPIWFLCMLNLDYTEAQGKPRGDCIAFVNIFFICAYRASHSFSNESTWLIRFSSLSGQLAET